MALPKQLTWELAQTKWASEIDPVLKNILVNGTFLPNIALTTGANTINHRLGRKPQGYILVDLDAAAIIYRSQPFNSLTLTLTTNADCNIGLWVF